MDYLHFIDPWAAVAVYTHTHTDRHTHTCTHMCRQTDRLPQTSLAHAHRGHNYCPKLQMNVIIIIVLQDAGDYHGDKTDLEVRAHNSSEHECTIVICAPSVTSCHAVDHWHTNAADLIYIIVLPTLTLSTAIRMTLHSSALPLNGIYVCMHAQWSRNRGGGLRG